MLKSDKIVGLKKKIEERNKEKSIQPIRFYVQVLFALLCIWIGVEFFLFVTYLESGGSSDFFSRPPGVDGFLPISSLMSFYYFLITGEIHTAHPAGFFIFIAIVISSFFIGKSFCSWLCPIGFLSELIGDFGQKIFKKKLKINKWIDYPLRSLKYLMLGFLIYSVFFLMSTAALKAFLDSEYNLVADVKMYYFFADISRFSLIVLFVLFVLSIPFRGFWCRYLCPYGALLGLVSLISPVKIKRVEKNCIDCSLCTKACPSFINVEKVSHVISDECTSCFSCIDACPVADTLYVETVGLKQKINKKYAAFIVVGSFMLITGIGMISDKWDNHITKEQYLELYKDIDSYGHPRGTKDIKNLNKETQKTINHSPELEFK